MRKSSKAIRYSEIERETHETKVSVVLDLDGGAKIDIGTSIEFFDHMLTLFAYHCGINVGIKAEGDTGVDDHHTIEDVGIVLGQALREALFAEARIERYGHAVVPMDEALVNTTVDISGRGVLVFDAEFKREMLGEMSTENVREFFYALATNAGITLHIHQMTGSNDHHICEAIFKSFGRALRDAAQTTPGRGPKSTKGKLG
jgi:imidazoleglycerol-phosphate dehydratase